MEDTYILKVKKSDYDRIVHLVEKEEINRVKSREKSRSKPGGLLYVRGIIKKKIEIEVVDIVKNNSENMDNTDNTDNTYNNDKTLVNQNY